MGKMLREITDRAGIKARVYELVRDADILRAKGLAQINRGTPGDEAPKMEVALAKVEEVFRDLDHLDTPQEHILDQFTDTALQWGAAMRGGWVEYREGYVWVCWPFRCAHCGDPILRSLSVGEVHPILCRGCFDQLIFHQGDPDDLLAELLAMQEQQK